MKQRRLPGLSIRAAVLAAVLIGIAAPAALLLLGDDGSTPARVLIGRIVLVQLLAAGLATTVVLALRLSRPVMRLTRRAEAITPSQTLLPTEGDDELSALDRQMGALQNHSETLAAEVDRQGARLHKLAMVDPLTGLPNRGLFRQMFQHEAATARRSDRPMAMLFIDLDRFKTINDAMGHAIGDALLLGTSQRLLQAVRESDLVCRQNGDEFLVLLHHADRWETVAVAVERLLRAIEAPLPLRPGATPETLPQEAPLEVEVSACIGIAMFPRDGEVFEDLVRHAEQAMHQSKQLGRARYSFFHADLDKQLMARAGIERELARAINQHELILHYQPVVDASTGAWHGCEALVRWNHPTRGLLQPASFIGVAEESGLVCELGAWTLDSACAQIAAWRDEGLEVGRVSVNVSALQFRDQRLIGLLETSMERHRVRADQLEIELTESTLMSDDDVARSVIAALRGLGLALVLDDFGTGYSSLSYLKRLRPDKLKIDRSFVQDLPGDADDCALTAAILSMAQALDIVVVAEGVDKVAQQTLLVELGCDLLQGYLTGRPMPAETISKLLREPALLKLPELLDS